MVAIPDDGPGVATEITVDCFVMHLRGASEAEASEDLRQPGPQFVTMLQRIEVR